MARTTVDIADSILRDLKKLRAKERKPLGRLISELLAQALAQRSRAPSAVPPFKWQVGHGRLLVDSTDKEALAAIWDEDERSRLRG